MSTSAPDPLDPEAAETRYDLDDQVGYLLRLATQRHAAIFQAHAVASLTPTQFSALIRLHSAGAVSQNQLGRLASMDIATIKGVVDRLRQKELVTTRPSPDDRRRTMVTLSEKGAALIGSLVDAGRVITEETLKPLNATERRSLLRLLKKLA